jgi:hypothetical protein
MTNFAQCFAVLTAGIRGVFNPQPCEARRFTPANRRQLLLTHCAYLLLLLVAFGAHAQRPLMPLPVQAEWRPAYYRFATAPLGALRRQVTGPAGSTDESYHLRVEAGGASLTAVSPLGIQRGIATFRQVLERTPR